MVEASTQVDTTNPNGRVRTLPCVYLFGDGHSCNFGTDARTIFRLDKSGYPQDPNSRIIAMAMTRNYNNV